MISITNISKTYGKRILFEKINLSINRGEKIGLVGPNGAGKTTLFLMIMGKTELSAGIIHLHKSIRIGYLAQEARFESKTTVLSEVIEGDETITRLKKEKDALEINDKADTQRYGDVLHDLEFLGYFDLEPKAKKVLMGLGFKESDFNRPINQMSGGWQMRVLLAKLLTCHYDILLLDEPTNYLDLSAALWLKDYLAGFKGTFIMISHDKAFLNEVTNYTLILENGSITKIKGNYDDYYKMRKEERNRLLRQSKEQEKKREQLEIFISRFHAQPNKASQVRAKKKMLEKMEEVIVPEDRRESIRTFHFPQGRRGGYRVMALEKISKSYGDITVYKDFDFEILRGEKAVLAGENGAGKSTLLKILAGVVNIDKGLRSAGHNVDIGYFSQARMETLNPYNTVLEEAAAAGGGRIPLESVRTILGAFLFSGSDVEKKVTILSGGEKSRLILAKLLINPPNCLLLDEPTTHLDADAVDALIKALTEYEGTLVFISHDIHFVRSAANIVFEVKSGRVRKFPGNFDYYWQKAKDTSVSKEHVSQANSVRDRLPKATVGHLRCPISNGVKAREGKIPEAPQEKKIPEAPQEKKIPEAPQEKKIPLTEEQKKECNTEISKKIKELRRKKEKLELEQYAKNRILSGPRREEVLHDYTHQLKEIEKKIAHIDEKIQKLKQAFLI